MKQWTSWHLINPNREFNSKNRFCRAHDEQFEVREKTISYAYSKTYTGNGNKRMNVIQE